MKRRVSRINAVNVTVWRSFCLRVGAAMAAVCVCAALLTAQSGGITTKDAKAKEAVDAAIKAIGGSGKIGDIKSLVIKGTLGRFQPAEMEIRILLPDSFVQIVESSLDGHRYEGISQGKLIPPPYSSKGKAGHSPEEIFPSFTPPKISNHSGTPGGETAPASLESAEDRAERHIAATNNFHINRRTGELSRFLIGTLMKTGSAPMTISSGSTSGVFNLTKNDGEAAGEIEFDSKSGYPSVIRYENPKPPPGHIMAASVIVNHDGSLTVGGISAQNPGGGEIRFQDHFSVSGIMFPKVITYTQWYNDTVTELRIEEVLINPKLSLKNFEVPQR